MSYFSRHKIYWARTLLRMFGFAGTVALFGLCAAMGCATQSHAQEKQPEKQAENQDPEPDNQPKTASAEEETFKEPLSAEGMSPGAIPSALRKVVVLLVPNADSWKDNPLDDLSGDSRIAALCFQLALEQQIDFKPHLWKEEHPRKERYYARLRFCAIPGREDPAPNDKPVAGLELAARSFNADIVFAVNFSPAKGDLPARCLLWRYCRNKAIDAAFRFDLPALGVPEADSAAKLIEAKAAQAVAGTASKEEEARLSPVPPLCASDKALKSFAAMREGHLRGDLDGAWIAYADLLKADARCGRAAFFAMDIFYSHPSQASPLRAIQEGIRGVKLSPNDALLRARVAFNANMWFKRRDWAAAALAQAAKAQPRNFQVLQWQSYVLADNDPARQRAWIVENMLPHFKDGRVEIGIGNIDAQNNRLGDAILWYEKAIALSPDDHEAHFSLALISTHHGENLQRAAKLGPPGDDDRAQALKCFNAAVKSWSKCLELDVTEQQMVLDFYVRAATHDYKFLPMEDAEINRLFLVQAVRNGLDAGGAGAKFAKLAGQVMEVQAKLQRMLVREVRPESPDYELALCARLNFDLIDNDLEDAAIVMRAMRKIGFRGGVYLANISRFAPILDED